MRFHLVIEDINVQTDTSGTHKKIDLVCSSNAKLWREKHILNLSPLILCWGGAALELSHEIDLRFYFVKNLNLFLVERCRDFGNGTVDERWFAKFKSDEVTML